MKIPLKWLENYISVQHTPREVGDILTSLEFLQDGPIEEINGQPVLDIEVRQNRPDCLSIIGVAREYAAYINRRIELPKEQIDIEVPWGEPESNLSVSAKDIVKRFCSVEIRNIQIRESPEWLRKNLEAYGVPSINNIVDITNYVMLEYGIPLHAFDRNKLKPNTESQAFLELRKAINGETLTTWQGTELKLTSKDLVVASGDVPISIAGIIGGANSDIDNDTTAIILEAADYNQASIRRTALRHNLRTDAATRHEKFLNPEMVEPAIRRAIYLILEQAGGEIVKIEDFYPIKLPATTIEFNLFEIPRIGGVEIEAEKVIDILQRLGFEIIDQKEAIGIHQHLLIVKVPDWRTDVSISADILEEVLRLWGYENIPLQPIREAPEDYSTPLIIQLEEKIRDILVSLGLDEHITSPLVKANDAIGQIVLENPLNRDQDALRTTIEETLDDAVITYEKAGHDKIAVFEVGKIYHELKKGEYSETKQITTLYKGYDFARKVKPDLHAILSKLGFEIAALKTQEHDMTLEYLYDGKVIGILRPHGYDLKTEVISEIVDVQRVPVIQVRTGFYQKIIEEISFIVNLKTTTGDIAKLIYDLEPAVTEVKTVDMFKDDKMDSDEYSLTLSLRYESSENKLTREYVQKSREKIINEAQNKLNIKLRA